MSSRHNRSQESETCRSDGDGQDARDLEQVVHRYIVEHRERASRELHYYAMQRRFEDAIELAALSKLPNGKRHPHQYRVPGRTLEAAKQVLLSISDELRECETFEELFETINAEIRPIKGIGELAVYDIALRIGAYLELAPERVYLHSGTRAGAKAIGLYDGQDALAVSELPEAFHELTAREVEDCLCIYKDELSRIRLL